MIWIWEVKEWVRSSWPCWVLKKMAPHIEFVPTSMVFEQTRMGSLPVARAWVDQRGRIPSISCWVFLRRRTETSLSEQKLMSPGRTVSSLRAASIDADDTPSITFCRASKWMKRSRRGDTRYERHEIVEISWFAHDETNKRKWLLMCFFPFEFFSGIFFFMNNIEFGGRLSKYLWNCLKLRLERK